jgi:hypothetical protein
MNLERKYFDGSKSDLVTRCTNEASRRNVNLLINVLGILDTSTDSESNFSYEFCEKQHSLCYD